MRRIRDSAMTTPPSTGSDPPDSPVPDPRATHGTSARWQAATTAAASGLGAGAEAVAPSTDVPWPESEPAAAVPAAEPSPAAAARAAPGNTLVKVTVARLPPTSFTWPSCGPLAGLSTTLVDAAPL